MLSRASSAPIRAVSKAHSARAMATKRVKRRKVLFDKILVANRGEISARVIETARSMGIKTVAIYSEPDRHAKHVKLADEAYCVGPAASSESYLNMDRIMEVVRESGAQAVHPGYGFLSENHVFAQRLADEGVAFVGPNAGAITAMGDKIQSKKIAKEAGVSVIPGFVGEVEDEEVVVKVSQEIGYPVMIKASAGGGGKGMRIAYSDEEAREGFRLSKEEARSSFGDDRILIEKFVENPRHIEIQVIGDKHGNVVALPERECSIQRRNQKVIEESPSTLLEPETRLAMQEQAKALSRAVNYDSAGTVEMLCDPQQNFYFLEMNTRLQVEHPVTEMVTGLDLVEHMLRSAAGEALPDELLRGPVDIHGWATECRVYAEDPVRNFLPSTGMLTQYEEPEGEGVRCDSGVLDGAPISMYYDPMICKLVTHGATREEANHRMEEALDRYVVRGVQHNIPFMRDVLRSPRYREGRLTTAFIDEEYPDGFTGVQLNDEEMQRAIAIAAIISRQHVSLERGISGTLDSKGDVEVESTVYVTPGPGADPVKVVMEVAEADEELVQAGEDLPPRIFAYLNDSETPLSVMIQDYNQVDPRVETIVDREMVPVQLLGRSFETFHLQMCGAQLKMTVREELSQQYSHYMIPKPEIDMTKFVTSPMPGLLVNVNVEEGQHVEAGQPVAVVEAMKMQNVLRAEKSGTVKKVGADSGATLTLDQVIVEFE